MFFRHPGDRIQVTQNVHSWIPAFAGMTANLMLRILILILFVLYILSAIIAANFTKFLASSDFGSIMDMGLPWLMADMVVR